MAEISLLGNGYLMLYQEITLSWHSIIFYIKVDSLRAKASSCGYIWNVNTNRWYSHGIRPRMAYNHVVLDPQFCWGDPKWDATLNACFCLLSSASSPNLLSIWTGFPTVTSVKRYCLMKIFMHPAGIKRTMEPSLSVHSWALPHFNTSSNCFTYSIALEFHGQIEAPWRIPLDLISSRPPRGFGVLHSHTWFPVFAMCVCVLHTGTHACLGCV
jgi:hypothetical protein